MQSKRQGTGPSCSGTLKTDTLEVGEPDQNASLQKGKDLILFCYRHHIKLFYLSNCTCLTIAYASAWDTKKKRGSALLQ